MKLETFLEKFELFADAPDAVARMREVVLELGTTGRLSLNNSSKWKKVVLGDVVELISGQHLLAHEHNNEKRGVPYLTGPSDFGDTSPTPSRWTEKPKVVALPGDILLTVKGSGVGKTNVLIDQPTAISRQLMAVRVTKADPGFVHVVLQRAAEYFQTAKTGIAIPGIGRREVLGLKILLPPLAEQKRIVAKVDELMALCDQLEEQQQQRETRHATLVQASLARFTSTPTPANLQFLFHPSCTVSPADLRKTILTLAVQGKLVPQDPNEEPALRQLEAIKTRKTNLLQKKIIKKSSAPPPITSEEVDHEIPVTWEWVRLVEICELITDGTHQTPKYTENGRMFLSAQNVKPFKFMPEKHRFVSEEAYQGYVKNRKPEKDDVLLTRVGAGIGEAATIDQNLDFAIYVSLGLIRPVRGFVRPDYITLWLNSPDGTEKSSRNTYGKGVSQGNLNLSLIRNFLVPLPPLAEQHRIVAKVDELMALIDDLENQLATSRTVAQNLMAALVQELTTTH